MAPVGSEKGGEGEPERWEGLEEELMNFWISIATVIISINLTFPVAIIITMVTILILDTSLS